MAFLLQVRINEQKKIIKFFGGKEKKDAIWLI